MRAPASAHLHLARVVLLHLLGRLLLVLVVLLHGSATGGWAQRGGQNSRAHELSGRDWPAAGAASSAAEPKHCDVIRPNFQAPVSPILRLIVLLECGHWRAKGRDG